MMWEELESWLFESNTFGGQFANADVAKGLGVGSYTATRYIQSYLGAQRRPKSRTLYVLHRSDRTTRAVWHVGVRAADVRATSHQFFDDTKRRFTRALEPDLARVAALNPRARRKCEAIIEAVGEGAMRLLQVAVDGIDDGGEGLNGA
jgi:hypothetical protein